MRLLAKLFLNTVEQEELLKLHDTLMGIDLDTEEQYRQRQIWCRVLSSLIFGKAGDKRIDYPIRLDGTEQQIK